MATFQDQALKVEVGELLTCFDCQSINIDYFRQSIEESCWLKLSAVATFGLKHRSESGSAIKLKKKDWICNLKERDRGA
jgi:hypothetical protein